MKRFKIAILFALALLLLNVGVYAQADTSWFPAGNAAVTFLATKLTWFTGVIMFLWLLSEALTAIPSVKANGVFQLVYGWITIIKGWITK